MRGDVVRWDEGRGYGFIKRDDNGPDIFVHHKGLTMDGQRNLEDGQRVEFEEKPGERLEAVHVYVLAVPVPNLDKPPRAATTLIPRAVARRAAADSSSSTGSKRQQASDAAPTAAPATKQRTARSASKASGKDGNGCG